MDVSRTNRRAATLSADDWVGAASRAMGEGGIGAVAVEPLAQRLGVTKGSFYWHFADRASLLRAVLNRWEERSMEEMATSGVPIGDPRAWLVRFIEETSAEELGEASAGEGDIADRAVSLAVADAADDPIVGPVVRRVSARRLAVLEACFRALGFVGDDARSRALLMYAAHVGTLRLAREAPDWAPRGDDLRTYRRHLVAAMVPAEKDAEGGGDRAGDGREC